MLSILLGTTCVDNTRIGLDDDVRRAAQCWVTKFCCHCCAEKNAGTSSLSANTRGSTTQVGIERCDDRCQFRLVFQPNQADAIGLHGTRAREAASVVQVTNGSRVLS